jgi:hypothetical protein
MECVTPEMEWTRVVAKIAILADSIFIVSRPRFGYYSPVRRGSAI